MDREDHLYESQTCSPNSNTKTKCPYCKIRDEQKLIPRNFTITSPEKKMFTCTGQPNHFTLHVIPFKTLKSFRIGFFFLLTSLNCMQQNLTMHASNETPPYLSNTSLISTIEQVPCLFFMGLFCCARASSRTAHK